MGSWLDKVKKQFSITMGDGRVYKPSSFNANRATEYNIAEFDFRNLDGTLVDRRRKRGTVYNLELYFQGTDNIDVATAFQSSADDNRPWEVNHPFYGNLLVQPISPVFHDNGNKLLNVTRITVTIRETITSEQLTNVKDANTVIAAKQQNANAALAAALTSATPAPSVKVLTTMTDNLTLFQQALAKAKDTGSIIANGYNAGLAAVNSVYGAVNDIATQLSSAITAIQYFINLPVLLEDSIFNKVSYINNELKSLYEQGRQLNTGLLTELSFSRFLQQYKDLKNVWCTNAGSCLSSMCLAATFSIQPSDYTYNYQVNAVIAQITTAYNTYLSILDGMQTPNGGDVDSFIPDPNALIALDDLVNFTIDSLYVIQSNSKQPRVVTLTKDNNVILIARELYGLLPDDSTINQIIADNNICNSEIFQVLKGRQILYYV